MNINTVSEKQHTRKTLQTPATAGDLQNINTIQKKKLPSTYCRSVSRNEIKDVQITYSDNCINHFIN